MNIVKGNIFSQDIPYIPQVSMLIANFVPLFGVIFFNWQVSSLLTLYWAESGVIGFYTVLKMMRSERKSVHDKMNEEELKNKKLEGHNILVKSLISFFFICHFGLFMFVHGIFLLAFFSDFESFGQVSFSGVIVALFCLLVSHGISFYENYLKNEEYKKYSLKKLMGLPYYRIFVMHVIVISTGFIAVVMDQRIWSLLLLIVFKILFDLKAHIKEHNFDLILNKNNE